MDPGAQENSNISLRRLRSLDLLDFVETAILSLATPFPRSSNSCARTPEAGPPALARASEYYVIVAGLPVQQSSKVTVGPGTVGWGGTGRGPEEGGHRAIDQRRREWFGGGRRRGERERPCP